MYECILSRFCSLLAEQGIAAVAHTNTTARIDPLEPRYVIEIETDNKRALYPILRRLPGVYKVARCRRDSILMYVNPHELKTVEGLALAQITSNLDHVLSAYTLDDKRLVLYFTDNTSVVLAVESLSWHR